MKTRDIIAVTTLSILTLSTWGAMFNIASLKVWNRTYALAMIKSSGPNPVTYNSQQILEETYISYLTRRYVFYLPHAIGAFVWWNLFFLQLIPSLRRKYKTLHRWMGRLLLLAVLSQVLSGVALAYYGFSATIAWVSYTLAIATIVCVFKAAKAAMMKDFNLHKYWAMRLVGYLQMISGQRFWTIVLFACQHTGVFRNMEHPFYPQLEEDSPQSLVDSVVVRMFHDTFIIAWFFAFVGTELYLAAAKKDNAFGDKVQDGRNVKVGYEKIPTKSFISYQSIDTSD
jgi:hypothetical protein